MHPDNTMFIHLLHLSAFFNINLCDICVARFAPAVRATCIWTKALFVSESGNSVRL